ncbi:amino acid ABC transporter substrate-binding protein [Azospirillum sp.]|uniref:amino acid ABC transporter substrate-binding protein n=1 Tax=Azospirillum sp. TaxID=34012 RepID=UPI002622D0BF|nr:amino acid ABC transporter substrate-binding protein [Azospirillum sp.]
MMGKQGTAPRRFGACLAIGWAGLLLALGASTAQAGRLDDIRQRGAVRCAVSTGVAGFSLRGSDGRWRGFDVDYCRALAAAVLGDSEKVSFISGTTDEALGLLTEGTVDVLSRSATVTLSRLAGRGLESVGISLFDGQSFMTKRGLRIRTLHQMAGLGVCFQSGTTAEDNLTEHFAMQKINFRPVPKGPLREMIDAYLTGECDIITTDSSALAAIRVMYMPRPEDHVILRQHISKEPLGPLVRKGDDGWREITRWTLSAMIEAEELGLSSKSIIDRPSSDSPRVRRLLGMVPGIGRPLGLDDEWAWRVIAQVGNYGEVFESNIGLSSPLHMERGLNELWTRGGLLFALPLR